jgi:hypothetical protein
MSLLKPVENFSPVDPEELLAATVKFIAQYPFDNKNGDQRCFLNTKDQAHNPNPYQGIGGKNWKNSNANPYHENDFTEFLPEWKNSIFHRIYENFPLPVSRMRLMRIRARTCYSIHSDGPGAFKYHIAIYTNPAAYWIYADTLEMVHVPADGRCYEFDGSRLHTFANFNKVGQYEDRYHLVLNAPVPE